MPAKKKSPVHKWISGKRKKPSPKPKPFMYDDKDSKFSVKYYPPILARACMVRGNYALRSITDDDYCFQKASFISPFWVRLHEVSIDGEDAVEDYTDGNIDMSVDKIVWVGESP